MRGRDVPEEIIERVLDRFGEVGLIDDAAFAQAWVDSRHHGRSLARRALADELRRKGVDAETVDEAVQALDPTQEEATARALIRKRLRATRNVDPQVRFRRIAGTLARKGYPGGLVFRIIREELEAEGADTTALPEEPF
ncbi:MAG: RecX family transcriptional regulator [Streptosporangiales bacterium]|nr:RecX family transcriptional regulator [Streptosporangiales bacterium]